jgi:toxin YhaV
VSSLDFERYQGWLLLAHPHFEDQYAKWSNQVLGLARKDPDGFKSNPKTKRFATLEKLVFEVIPSDPANRLWLQGNTLGPENRAWRRAKFFQQYRLFFRYDSNAKIIIYGWINDEQTLRARQTKSDAYTVFQRMLESGNPPTDWDELLKSSNYLK